MQFTYRTPYSLATSLDDNVEEVVGLPAIAQDIPPLGVAVQQLRTTESRRNQVQSQTDARRSEEVTPTANNTDAQRLERVYQRRVNEEYVRQITRTPVLMGI